MTLTLSEPFFAVPGLGMVLTAGGAVTPAGSQTVTDTGQCVLENNQGLSLLHKFKRYAEMTFC